MAYDESIATKVRAVLARKRHLEEKKMFGGLCFLYKGHMCFGVVQDKLMIRVGPEKYQEALKETNASPMDFTGKPLKGFIYVSQPGFRLKRSLEAWLTLGVDYAKSLPPKSK